MEFFKSIITSEANVGIILLLLLLTLALSITFSLSFCLIKKNDGYSKDITFTYVILPVVICAITLAVTYIISFSNVSENVSRYERVVVALLAALILIRFRSIQKSTEELTYIFFLVVFAILMGMGYVSFGLILYAIVLIVLIVLHILKFPILSKNNLSLKITIPEDLNYEDAFDDIFSSYTSYHQLSKIKSSDVGTMFVLSYDVVMKKDKSTKDFIDEIRQRNGNLNVIVTIKRNSQE